MRDHRTRGVAGALTDMTLSSSPLELEVGLARLLMLNEITSEIKLMHPLTCFMGPTHSLSSSPSRKSGWWVHGKVFRNDEGALIGLFPDRSFRFVVSHAARSSVTFGKSTSSYLLRSFQKGE